MNRLLTKAPYSVTALFLLIITMAGTTMADQEAQKDAPALLKWNMDELSARNAKTELPYLEFMRLESMSGYIYELAAGTVDGQEPHDQDEIYYVVKGRSDFTVNDETIAIQPGDVLYVKKFAKHLFSNITEDLSLLVIFAPPDTE
jgi:mannose-6-phosphate isomerase-like protein (cupin superfamily)